MFIPYFQCPTKAIPYRIQHEPVGRGAGLTDSHLQAIRDVSYIRCNPRPSRPPTSPPLSPVMSAALAYTDAMTIDIKVPDDIFAALKAHLSDKEIMEVTATIASYNLVSRVLVALDVGDMAGVEVPDVGVAASSQSPNT